MMLLVLLCLVAFLYSSVGHAGASGYIATMSLLHFAPESIRPTALVLNLFVAIIATTQFTLAGHFRWKLFWPFALCAVPCAFLAAKVPLPPHLLKVVLGVVLLLSALRLLVTLPRPEEPQGPSLRVALPSGAALGFLAGLSGTGGGIFLTPLMLLANWATAKQAAAVSAPFILVNSAAGLLGFAGDSFSFPPHMPVIIAGVILAGGLGSGLSAWKLPAPAIRLLLSAALLVASAKFLLPF